MSWQGYIDNLTTPDADGNTPVKDAAICGISAGQQSVWASSPGLAKITEEEIKRLAGNRSSFRTDGPTIAGMKCMMLRDQMDEDQVFTLDLKTSKQDDGQAYSICVGKSKSVLVMVQGKKDAVGGQLASKVFGIVDYLRKSNM
ncbi:profilin-1-like [Dicentrarchus labrax]|uniref:profilin-1-like n=1 Tax=Dicentrarchus labrax TaxID=13489 RepID=UPI0021F5BF61|nr:profilin-1-like [Dicentrarchus labrax]